MTITKREQEEAAGVALMVRGLQAIHDANGGDSLSVARVLGGAIASYMVHVADVGDQPPLWILKLCNITNDAYRRTLANQRNVAKAARGTGTVQ